tara:strand:+ start:941 stop:1378 length:438 start_codon:yes stop_codon:yes gene_type:complete
MSYFAVIANIKCPIEVSSGRLLELSQSQYYIAGLKQWIEETDGAPALFWDDADTDTSTEVLVEVHDAAQAGVPVEDTTIGHLIKDCADTGATLRIWWAGKENAHANVVETKSLEETLALVRSQLKADNDISFVMKVDNDNGRGAA